MKNRSSIFVATVTGLVSLSALLGCIPADPVANGTGGMKGGSGGQMGSGGSTSSGGSTGSGGSSGSGGSAGKATFSAVRSLMKTTCAVGGCHDGGFPPVLLDDNNLYATLTSYESGGCESNKLVKPGSPDESAMAILVKGECGRISRMPYNCDLCKANDSSCSQCLSNDVTDGIRQWIADGAPQQ
jgi:hypothetical protein